MFERFLTEENWYRAGRK